MPRRVAAGHAPVLRGCAKNLRDGAWGIIPKSGRRFSEQGRSTKIMLQSRAAFWSARISRGVLPVQRLNAWVKALTSRYPSSQAICEIDRAESAM